MYLVTRRCTQRQFLLKPSKRVNLVFVYLLAVASERYNVTIHAFCVLSNHWHCVVTDHEGQLPKFMAFVHKYAAKCINASLGRWENLWASEPASAVRLETVDDALEKVVYTICNPVSSFLVDSRDKWPGLVADWTTKPIRATRPDWYFRPDGCMPEQVTLELAPPNAVEGSARTALTRRLRKKAAAREAELRRDARKNRIKFLGVERVLRQKVTDAPHTVAPRRGISPRIAAKDRWRRIEGIRRVDAFVKSYRVAWLQWKAGFRDVEFPAGTYAMRVHQGARCADC
jgi:REP element-mobilizing transposase RayT